jgi:hypothetical protein
MFGYPSWKVIVSAQRGQYSKPGSREPGFFFVLTSKAFSTSWPSTPRFHHEKSSVPLTAELTHRIIEQ